MMKTLLIGALVIGILVGALFLLKPSLTPSPTGNEVASGTTPTGETSPQAGIVTGKTTAPVYVQPKTDAGRMIFAITDAAVNLDNIKSIFITTTNIQLHNDKAWVTVSTAPKTYDLLELKRTGSSALLADVAFAKGTYNQLRLTVSGVQIVFNDGTTHAAKLPSGELRVIGLATVEKGQTSAVIFDFDASRSLHMTGDGRYIFAPVLKILTRTNVNAQILAGGKVRVFSGTASIEHNVGMDENGIVKDDFAIDPAAQLDLIDNVIKIKPQNASEEGVQISASQAIATARTSGNLDVVLSVTIVMRDNAKIWRVVGVKNSAFATVDVSASTGAIIK